MTKEAKPDTKKTMEVAKMFVTKQYKLGGKDTEPSTKEEELEVSTFVTEPAKVSLEMGLTLNMGNYEAARITVSATVPCYNEEMNDAFAFTKLWVVNRLVKERDLIKNKNDTDII